MMKKWFIGVLASACIAIGGGSVVLAYAAENAPEQVREYAQVKAASVNTSSDGKWHYTLEYGKATLTEYLGSETNLVIPEKIDSAQVVTFAGNEAFRRSISNVTTIAMPNTVNVLPKNCFKSCKKLESVTLSSGVTTIPAHCFSGCSALATVKNYGNVTTINYDAFSYCTSLKEFDLSKIEDMGTGSSNTFRGCTSLTGVSFSPKLKRIPMGSFQDCTSLQSVSLKKGLEEIQAWAFSGCTSLKNISFPSTLNHITGNAFEESGLEKVTVPATVTKLGDDAFRKCSNLKTVVYNTAHKIPRGLFASCTSLTDVSICSSVPEIGIESFAWCTELSSITIPENTKVNDRSFTGCERLSVIYSVKGSSAEAFAGKNGILFKELKSLSGAKVSSVANRAYTGKAITPAVTVKSGSKKLEAGKDYTLAYTDNKKIGRACITVIGKGDYLGECVVFFNIVPPKTTVKKLESGKKGELTVTVSTSQGAKGYVIAYSTKKSGGYKTVYTTKPTAVIKGLTSGSTYYVKAAPYTVILAKKQSPAYSAVKSKKVS